MGHVLIVDDEPTICWGFRELLSEEGHSVQVASSAEEGLELAQATHPDAVILDVRLPGMDGLTAVGCFRESVGDVPIVVMTAFGNLETAVRAMESGVVEYLPKPFDLEDAARVVERVLRPAATGHAASPASADDDALVGSSRAMQEVFKQIALAAGGDVPVLITGESGTGKELVARAIHRHSRRSGPFQAVSLAALSPTLAESELFGHVRGAFTGAETDRAGVLELADDGTVLLDEISEAPLEIQVKLLRAIERKEIQRVGDIRVRKVGFRVIAATNRSLLQRIEEREFREDLYFRLGVYQIQLPPLRQRLEDIPELSRHFLRRAGGSQLLTDEALQELRRRPWRGNVRELRNVIEHAALVSRGREIGPEAFPPPEDGAALDSVESELRGAARRWTAERLAAPGGNALHERLLQVIEPELLQEALQALGGNRAATAEKLGIHRATLRQKLRRYGLDDSPE